MGEIGMRESGAKGLGYLEALLGGAKVEWRPLGEVAELKRGVRVVRRQLEKEGQYPVYQNCLTPLGYFDKANCKAETAFVIMGGSAGKVGFSNVDFWAADDCLYFITPEYLLSRYLYYFLCKKETYLDSQVRRAAVPRLARSVLANLLIPLPPLPVQERIVEILDKFTTLIEALETERVLRTQQYAYYRNRLLRFGKEVEWRPLGEVAELKRGRVISKKYIEENAGQYPVYSSQTLNNGEIGRINTFDFDCETVTWTTDGVYAGTVFYRKGKFSITNICGMITILDTQRLNYLFLFFWLSIEARKHVNPSMGNAKVMNHQIAKILIPLPPLPIQQQIVDILDKFHSLVHSLTEGLPAEIALRRQQYEYYRNQLLRFPR